jgi:archaellum component FlaC
MVKNAHKKQDTYITLSVFERNMAAIAKSFNMMDDRFDRVEAGLTGILSEIQGMRAEASGVSQSIVALSSTDALHESSIDDLQERVEKLELKTA